MANVFAGCPVIALRAGCARRGSSLPDAALLVVETGLVAICTARSRRGSRVVVLEGGAWTVAPAPSPDGLVRGLADSRVTAVPAGARDRLLASPAGARLLVDGLAESVRKAQRTLDGLASPGRADDRIRQKLLQLALDYGRVAGDGVRIEFPLTHELLAEMTGAARETVTRTMAELRREGFVVRRGRFYGVRVPPEALLAPERLRPNGSPRRSDARGSRPGRDPRAEASRAF